MKKRLLKLSILFFIILLVFLIYKLFKTDKINYISLGDTYSLGVNPYGEISYGYSDYLKDRLKVKYYTKEYSKDIYDTTSLLKEITINNSLKKDLRESNLVTISIGIYDFLNKNTLKVDINNLLELKETINKIIPNIDKCIKEIRKYAKNDVIIIGYYNPVPFLFNTSSNDLDTLFKYIDTEYEKIANKYDCMYISTYLLFKNNKELLPNPNNIHPSSTGYKLISDLILNNLK